MNRYTVGWLAWGAFFAALEASAIAIGQWENTLSGHVHRWIGLLAPEQTAWTRARQAALVAFLSWLTGHLAFGVWGVHGIQRDLRAVPQAC